MLANRLRDLHERAHFLVGQMAHDGSHVLGVPVERVTEELLEHGCLEALVRCRTGVLPVALKGDINGAAQFVEDKADRARLPCFLRQRPGQFVQNRHHAQGGRVQHAFAQGLRDGVFDVGQALRMAGV